MGVSFRITPTETIAIEELIKNARPSRKALYHIMTILIVNQKFIYITKRIFLLLLKSRFAKTVILSFIMLIGIAQTGIFLNAGIASESDPGYEAGSLIVNDPNLKSELVYKGIQVISNMAFLGPDDILVLERIEGTVKRIVNGTMQQDPLIDFNVVYNNQNG